MHEDAQLVAFPTLFVWVTKNIHHSVTDLRSDLGFGDVGVLVDYKVSIGEITTDSTESFNPSYQWTFSKYKEESLPRLFNGKIRHPRRPVTDSDEHGYKIYPRASTHRRGIY